MMVVQCSFIGMKMQTGMTCPRCRHFWPQILDEHIIKKLGLVQTKCPMCDEPLLIDSIRGFS